MGLKRPVLASRKISAARSGSSSEFVSYNAFWTGLNASMSRPLVITQPLRFTQMGDNGVAFGHVTLCKLRKFDLLKYLCRFLVAFLFRPNNYRLKKLFFRLFVLACPFIPPTLVFWHHGDASRLLKRYVQHRFRQVANWPIFCTCPASIKPCRIGPYCQ